MIGGMISAWLALAFGTQALPAAALGTPVEQVCADPVLMVVTGTTHDRERMLAYGAAIAQSGLYRELGGYYVNVPRAIAHFEGEAEEGHVTLIVRFPCLANASAFWNSRTYREDILPLRLDPSAGTFIVRVYPEAPLPDYMQGQVGEDDYQAQFDAARVEQAQP